MNKELIDGLRTGKYYVHCETEEEIREAVRIVESLFPEKHSDFREEWLVADRNWIRFQLVIRSGYWVVDKEVKYESRYQQMLRW